MIGAYLLVLLVSAGTTAALIPVALRVARRVGAIAMPNDRKVHDRPTPQFGGPAMMVGVMAGVGTAAFLGQFRAMFESPANIVGVLVSAMMIVAVGAIDDIREVSAPAKVAGIVLAGSVLVLSGLSIVNLPLPILGFTVLSPDMAALVTVLLILVVTNAVNLADGLDGLASGMMAIASGAFLLYAVKLDDSGALTRGNVGPLIAVVTLGVCLGFLVWNFHPAKIFMGDSGALLLGLLMASASVAVGGQSDDSFTGQSWFFFAPIVIPLLILGVPLVDMTFAIVRRTTSGVGFATRDKDHLHHRLLRLGHGYRQTVVLLWAWTALLCAFALYPAITGKSTLMIPIAAAAGALALFTMLAPLVNRRAREVDRELDEEIDRKRVEYEIRRSGSVPVVDSAQVAEAGCADQGVGRVDSDADPGPRAQMMVPVTRVPAGREVGDLRPRWASGHDRPAGERPSAPAGR
ncbi:MAG: MraY family glycosyltransferase [Microthrixaceae bacterium]